MQFSNRGKLHVNFPKYKSENALFQGYMDKNALPGESPVYSDYDYLSAFRGGATRDDDGGHLEDTYKRPYHGTFSDESGYYQDGMPAVHWDGENQVPKVNDVELQDYLVDRSRKRTAINTLMGR